FFFDSPALYPDVWVQLCRAAECTERIGLGPGVLIPSLRHRMTNATAIDRGRRRSAAARQPRSTDCPSSPRNLSIRTRQWILNLLQWRRRLPGGGAVVDEFLSHAPISASVCSSQNRISISLRLRLVVRLVTNRTRHGDNDAAYAARATI